MCIGVGAAHAQYWLCARITERPPKILKIFTRNTENTVDGLRALSGDSVAFCTHASANLQKTPAHPHAPPRLIFLRVGG